MNTMMFSDIDIFEIRRIADRYQLDLIVLFGSYAKGTFRPSSDMDIAVHTTRKDYAMRDDDSKAFWEMELFDDLNAVLKAPEGVDLVVLNRANSTLLYEVARYGIPLYQREKDTFHQFRSYAARRFYDDAKFRRLSWEYLKRRCLNGERDI
ncbi:nucleotidyltransferase domain-containing protein [Candidatus Poribacteria bacterium]|nr:nucleotidyltransferase domain-containing protein [Candidatus Poribacteria bacterium]